MNKKQAVLEKLKGREVSQCPHCEEYAKPIHMNGLWFRCLNPKCNYYRWEDNE